jgi:polyisoprenyl-phosphate glycosyltransferase
MTNHKPIEISIIIPFLNESENIPALVSKLDAFCEDQPALSFEVIFIDDGSTDNSLGLLAQATIRFFASRVIKLSRNFGSYSALRAGVLEARGNYITFLYADLQDPPELVIRLYRQCRQGHEVAWAVRRSVATGLGEKIFSRSYAYLMKRFAIKNYPEKGFDVVMFSRKVAAEVNKNIESNSNIFLQVLTMGYRQARIEYDKVARKAGKSKWTFSKKVKLFVDSFVAFSYAPIRLVTLTGISLFVLGALYALYLIGRKLIFNDLQQGWTALVSLLMIGFGITNISLGIIAEYLWRTLDASRNRPVFIVDEIIELTRQSQPLENTHL